MNNFAEVEDIKALWRNQSTEEEARAEALLPFIASSLRMTAYKVGKDLDEMIRRKPYLADVAKAVTVDVVARTLMTSTNQEPVSQFAESAMGYSISGTYLVPGGGLFIKKSELARLGLRRQQMKGISLWAEDSME